MNGEDADLPKAGFFMRKGMMLFTIVVVILLLAAALIPMPSTVNVSATIIAAKPYTTVQMPDNGTIDSIYISENAIVRQGDLLFHLQDANDPGTVNEWLKAALTVLSSSDQELRTFTWPDNKLNAELLTAQADLMTAWQQYKTYSGSAVVSAKQREMREQSKLLEAQNTVIENQQKVMAEIAEIAMRDLSRIQNLDNPNAVGVLERDNAEITYLRYRKQERALSGAVIQNKFLASELSLKIMELESDYKLTVNNYKLDFLRETAKLIANLQEWELNKIVSAPHSGLTQFLTDKRAGYPFMEGEAIIGILRDSNSTRAIAELPFDKLQPVRVGQDIKLKVSGYPPRHFGKLEGTLSFIEPLPRQQGYRLRIDLKSAPYTDKEKKLELYENMPAQAEIIVDKKSLISQILDTFID